MLSSLAQLLSAQNYMPLGMCLLWQPALLWLHALSDSAIAVAHYTISVALIYFVSRRHDLVFRGIFMLTGAFILACGTTHVMGVVTLWHPVYWLDGIIKLGAALVSIATAFVMWQAMPAALAILPTSQLTQANGLLQHEIGERHRAEAALRDANAELERRVAEHTAELEAEVDQRRRTEATLRASEERWRGMFEASAVGVAVTDENQRFVAVNDAFQKMLGYTAEELCSTGPVEITHEDDRAATKKMINRMLADRRAGYDVEKRYLRKDGTVIWVRVSTARPPDADRGMRNIPTIIVDITERKRAEDSMHEARDALFRVARLSTVGELSASIAHELSQPLGAIVANGQACIRLLAGSGAHIEDAKVAVEEIIVDAMRASAVLKRVRAMVKNATPERRPLDINSAISEVLTLTRQELQRHRVSVQTTLDPELPLVPADRVQVQQVVMNLVMNGIEAMWEIDDGPRILILKTQFDNDHNVAVSVEDTGGGVDPADLGRIFEAFFTTKPEGMGMGLSICNSIVRAHGGGLSAAAGALGGSVFRFTLPAVQDAAA